MLDWYRPPLFLLFLLVGAVLFLYSCSGTEAASCGQNECSDAEQCYFGWCLSECVEHPDCELDERCDEGFCHPLDCAEIDCEHGTACYFGTCNPVCETRSDCDGIDASCEDGVCVDHCLSDEDDEIICPVVDFETLEVSDVSAHSARFRAHVFELPLRIPVQHGFCWSTIPEPAKDGGAECIDLGPAIRLGEFDHVQGVLPGRSYFVRAFVVDGQDIHYGAEVRFTTPTLAVLDVSASDDQLDAVEVSWSGIDGAQGYTIYRDGTSIGFALGDTTIFTDREASPAPPVRHPDLAASKGNYAVAVRLSWDEVILQSGSKHSYAVVAHYPNGGGEIGSFAEGQRRAPRIEYFQIEIDGDGAWMNTGPATFFDDETGPAGSIEPGYVVASEGQYFDLVKAELFGVFSIPGATRSYRVRIVTDREISPPSLSVQGWRGVGELAVSWQRSLADEDDNYVPIDDADEDVYFDTDLPDPGIGRYYRAIISADGVDDAVSAADRGFARVPLPRNLFSSTSFDLRKIDPDGNEVWIDHNHNSTAMVATDPDGAVYTTLYENGVAKHDNDGNHIWTFIGGPGESWHEGTAVSIAVDQSRHVYFGSRDHRLRKLDSNGNLIWISHEHAGEVRGLAVDANGFVYTAATDRRLRKFDIEANLVWERHDVDHTRTRAFAVDPEGNIYSAGTATVPNANSPSGLSLFYFLQKLDSDGNELWKIDDFDSRINEIAINLNGDVLVAAGGDSSSYGDRLIKFDADGTELWRKNDHSRGVSSVTVSPEGFIYTSSWDTTIKKRDPDGNEIWTATVDRAQLLAVEPGVRAAFPEAW